jgi:hypothetical protein
MGTGASIGGLGSVLTSSVTGNETLFGRVDRHLGEWTGAAADAFADRVNKIHDLLNKQSAYAAVQQENLRQYRRLGDLASKASGELTAALSEAWEAVDQHSGEKVLEFTYTLVETADAGAKYVFREKPTDARMTFRSHADVLAEVRRLARTAVSALSAAAVKAAEAINETVEAMACAENFPVRPAMLDVRSPEFSYEKFRYDTGSSRNRSAAK